MAHVTHFKKGDAGRVTHELERDKRPDGSWAFKPTGKIDQSRTQDLNYKMEQGRAADRVEARLSDPALVVPKRKDLNVMSDWVITCPEALQGDTAKRDRFFEVSYQFLKDRYGAENVVQGYVHLDETTPHMHAAVVPVKDGKVSSKALFTRAELHEFHKELDRVCETEFGMKGLILNGRTKGDYTIAELKQRTKDEQDLENRRRAVRYREDAVSKAEDRVDAREQALKAREQAVVEQAQRVARVLQNAVAAQKRAEEAMAEAEQLQKERKHASVSAPPWPPSDRAVVGLIKTRKFKTGQPVWEYYQQQYEEYRAKAAEQDARLDTRTAAVAQKTDTARRGLNSIIADATKQHDAEAAAAVRKRRDISDLERKVADILGNGGRGYDGPSLG